MRVSFDLIKYKIIPNITDPFDLLEISHTCRTLRDFIHSIERKCPNPDCEDLSCSYGGFQVFLRLLNIIAGIEKIDYSNSYHKCLVYQLRFILFPYKKRFNLSYKNEYREWNKELDIWTIFPSVGIESNDPKALFYIYWIMDRGTPNFIEEEKYKIDVFEPLKLMQNMSDLWCVSHKDYYSKTIFISGVWKSKMPSSRRIMLINN